MKLSNSHNRSPNKWFSSTSIRYQVSGRIPGSMLMGFLGELLKSPKSTSKAEEVLFKKTMKFCCYSTAFFAQNTFFPKNGYLCIEDNQTFSIYALAWLLVDSQQVCQLKISNRLSTAFWAVLRSSFLGQTLLISNTGLTLMLPSFKHCGQRGLPTAGRVAGQYAALTSFLVVVILSYEDLLRNDFLSKDLISMSSWVDHQGSLCHELPFPLPFFFVFKLFAITTITSRGVV